MVATISLRLRLILQRIQSKLAFEDWIRYPQFSTKFVRSFATILVRLCDTSHHTILARMQGLGRVAMLACILGILLGIHLALILLIMLYQYGIIEWQSSLLGPDRMQLLLQWSFYIVTLCIFHLLEFFVTALYNPTVTSSDSFLINHSIAYTAAALVRLFWLSCW
jgi:hypothetical protein